MRPESVAVIQQALELGMNFIDSADSYGRGKSEEFVAKAVEGRRHDVVIATKVASAVGEGPNDRGLSRKHIMDGVEASLKRLNTDYIDLFYAHQFDAQTPIEESVRAFDDLVRQGKVRYLACSNWQAWQLAHSLGIQERLNLCKWTAIQPSWNIVDGLDDPAPGRPAMRWRRRHPVLADGQRSAHGEISSRRAAAYAGPGWPRTTVA